MSWERRRSALITAGPTREYIDPVRYISNESSGQMGFALARAAVHLGLKTTLISGPVSLDTPEGVRRIDVVSARDMYRETLRLAKGQDIIIMCAAVADFRPKRIKKKKIKKTRKKNRGLTLKLQENPDILAEICSRRQNGQIIAGFALETNDIEKNARKKLKEKGCDWIIANSAKAIGHKTSGAILFWKGGKRIRLPQLPKDDLAIIILSHILT